MYIGLVSSPANYHGPALQAKMTYQLSWLLDFNQAWTIQSVKKWV